MWEVMGIVTDWESMPFKTMSRAKSVWCNNLAGRVMEK